MSHLPQVLQKRMSSQLGDNTPISSRRRLSNKLNNQDVFMDIGNDINETLQDDSTALQISNKSRRAEKRRSLILPAAGSPKLPRTTEEPSENLKLTNEQLVAHYASCMKLSTENKINSKNAFKLHLIDHMNELLSERKTGSVNFMEAGGTIYASAKIYASRVDAVHAEAYRVLNSLGMHSGEKEDNSDTETDRQTDLNTNTRRRKKRSKVLENQRTTLSAKDIETTCAIDLINTVDTSSTDGQLINNVIKTLDSITLFYHPSAKSFSDKSTSLYSVKADTNTNKPRTETNMETNEESNAEPKSSMVEDDASPVDVIPESDLSQSHNSVIENGALIMWKSFGKCNRETKIPSNTFTWDSDVTVETNEHGSVGFSSQSDTSQNILQNSQNNVTELDPIDDVWDDEVNTPNDDNFDQEQPTNRVLFSENARTHNEIDINEELLTSVNMGGEYSYFKHGALSLIQGPSHWKMRHKKPVAKITCSENGDVTEPKKKGKKAPFRLEINCPLSEENFAKSKKSLELGVKTKQKWKLPSEEKLCNFAGQDVFLDTMKCHHFSHLTIKPLNSLKSKNADAPTVLDTETYNYENTNDANNFCPEAEPEDDNNDNDNDPGFDLGATMFEATSFPDFSQVLTQQTSYMEMLKDGNNGLVTQPKKVGKIELAYAKKAKKIDVRRLKSAMWKCIEVDEEKTSDKNDSNDDDIDQTDKSSDSIKRNQETVDKVPIPEEQKQGNVNTKPDLHVDNFSQLYDNLPKLLPSVMSENLSIPLAFTCLLHLANEKVLKLEGNNDMTDVKIKIDHELQQ